jgi:adenosylcobinamide-GDP ribazoletransferase
METKPSAHFDPQGPDASTSHDQALSPEHQESPLQRVVFGALFAYQFLTVLPPVVRRSARPAELGMADAFFPLVGLALGLGLIALDFLFSTAIVLAPAVRHVMLIFALTIITGALHLDGLIDTSDGAFAGPDPAARLAAMRQPTVTPRGIVAVICLLALKYTALDALTGESRWAGLLVGPCLGRWAIVIARQLFPYARRDGSGRAFKDASGLGQLLFATTTAGAVAGLLFGVLGSALLLLAFVLVLALGGLISPRLGGLTGDVYGATCELVETSIWLVLGVLTGLSVL